MEFRKCGPEDGGAVEDLRGRVTAELQAGINYPRWSKEYPADGVAAAIAAGEQCAAAEDGRIAGAVVPGEAEDACSTAVRESRLTPDAYRCVHALAAAPEARGRDLGGFFAGSCLMEAGNRGRRAVCPDMVPENLPARRLHIRRGFRPVGLADLKRGLAPVPLWELSEYDL